MAQALDRLKESPSQTAGPYVHIGLTPNFCGIAGVYPDDLGADDGQRQDQGRAHHACACASSTAPARRSGTRWSRSGRPMRPGSTIRQRRRAARPIRISPAGAARPTDMDTGECVFETIKPGRVPSATAG